MLSTTTRGISRGIGVIPTVTITVAKQEGDHLMTIVIDEVKATELLKAAVEDRGPEFVYRDEKGEVGGCCKYWHTSTNSPGCIVGLALSDVGVVPDSLIRIDNHDGGELSAESLPTHRLSTAANETVKVTEDAARRFQRAQDMQDAGAPWGSAVEHALMHETDGD